MRDKYSSVYAIILFVFIQVAWLGLLGLWIARFVANHIIFKRIGERYAIHIESGGAVAILVIGLVLMVAVFVMISLVFRRLTIQVRLTRLYDNFIATMTHELKTPLSSILLYLDTLNSRELPADKQAHFIQLMQADAHRLNKLINSILDIAQLEKSKKMFNAEVFQLRDLVEQTCAEIRSYAKLPDQAISLSGQGDCRCVMDKEAFRIILDNLVDNSIKYSPETLRITIDMKCKPKKCIINYQDQGIGLPAGEHKNIFNKFYRVSDNRVPSVRGTGLGLFWVREILKYHGGQIQAVSPGVFQGTHFRIELPRYPYTKKAFLKGLLKNSNTQKK